MEADLEQAQLVIAEQAAALLQAAKDNSIETKKEKARRAILTLKKELAKNIDKSYDKYRIAHHYMSYHPQLQMLKSQGWWVVDVEPVPKCSIAEHAGAPKDHLSFYLKLHKEGEPVKRIHPCAKLITEE